MKRAGRSAAMLAMALITGCNVGQAPPGNSGAEGPAPAAEPAPLRLRVLVAATDLNVAPDAAADVILVRRPARILLPPIAEVAAGRAFVVQAEDRAEVRGSGGDTIAGRSGIILQRGESRMFVAGGDGRWLLLLDGTGG